jgi:hypothetical protein
LGAQVQDRLHALGLSRGYWRALGLATPVFGQPCVSKDIGVWAGWGRAPSCHLVVLPVRCVHALWQGSTLPWDPWLALA